MRRAVVIALLAFSCHAQDAASWYASLAAGQWTPIDLVPVAWYKADANANDTMGAYNGSLDGTEAYKAGINGFAFSYGGSSRVVVPCATVTSSDNMTLSAWIQKSETGVRRHLFCAGDTNSSQWVLAFDVDVNNKLGLQVTSNDVALIVSDVNTPTITTNWTHIVISCGAAGNYFWINGARITSGNITYTSGSATSPHGPRSILICNKTTIGARDIGSATGPSTPFDTFWDGGIDDFVIFNRVLTDAEVLKLYQWRQ